MNNKLSEKAPTFIFEITERKVKDIKRNLLSLVQQSAEYQNILR